MGANGLQAKLGDYSTGFMWSHKTSQERAGRPLVVCGQQREETALGGILCEPLGYRWRPLRQLELASFDLGESRFVAPRDVA